MRKMRKYENNVVESFYLTQDKSITIQIILRQNFVASRYKIPDHFLYG